MSEITAGKKRFVKRSLSKENPTVRIGKGGASQQVLNEVDKQLKTRKMVKVRILQTALINDKAKRVAFQVAEQTGASLVEMRGHTFMLYRPRQK
jgi:RNA-binding protein